MAKELHKINFSKATITKDGDRYIITEVSKDDIKDYDLSKILDSYVDIKGISLAIGTDNEIQPIDDE